MKEEDLAAAVVRYLDDLRWTIYQEVQVRSGDPIADIVAVQGPVVWAIECKSRFGLRVCSQAFRWKSYANSVSVAVKWRRWPAFETSIMKSHGIGALNVHGAGSYMEVSEQIRPELVRRPIMRPYLLNGLNARQQTYAAAGNAEGRRWSPFKETCRAVLGYVTRSPGCTFSDLLSAIDTHYASPSTARSALRAWIKEGAVDGVRMEKDGKVLRLYPAVE